MNKAILVLVVLGLFLIACSQTKQTDNNKYQNIQKITDIDKLEKSQKILSKNKNENIPGIIVSSQSGLNGKIIVKEVYLDKLGYAVLHTVVNGEPGPLISFSALIDGLIDSIELPFSSSYSDEKELIAMLHYDDGNGQFDQADESMPVKVNENVVMQKFSLITEDERNGGYSKTDGYSDVKTFNIIAKNWEFEPSIITVNKGDKVKIILKSIDVAHGFNLPDFDVRAILKPGNVEEIEFTADKAGTFSFYCDIPCGSGHSRMRGSLVVE